jgi:uncharacterized membrane protein
MKRIRLKDIPLRSPPRADWPKLIHRVMFGLFLAQYALAYGRLLMAQPLFGDAGWPDGVLVVLATATTLASLLSQLPVQNIILASFIIAGLGGASHTVGVLTGIPFGPFSYTSNIGRELFHPLPWAIPAMWIVIVLSSRGVARLILRRWRRTKNYGFWVIGLAALLVVVLALGLEPFATQVKRFWLWHPSRTTLHWYSTPWISFVGWAVTTVIILAFATPSLINKQPGKPSPPDYHPLVVWLLLKVLFAGAAAVHGLWAAAMVVAAAALVVSVFALKGAPCKTADPTRTPPAQI